MNLETICFFEDVFSHTLLNGSHSIASTTSPDELVVRLVDPTDGLDGVLGFGAFIYG